MCNKQGTSGCNMIPGYCPFNNFFHGKVRRDSYIITSNTVQQQHTLYILHAFQYCRLSLNKVSNDRRSIIALYAAAMISNIESSLLLLHMKCCVDIDNSKIMLGRNPDWKVVMTNYVSMYVKWCYLINVLCVPFFT